MSLVIWGQIASRCLSTSTVFRVSCDDMRMLCAVKIDRGLLQSKKRSVRSLQGQKSDHGDGVSPNLSLFEYDAHDDSCVYTSTRCCACQLLENMHHNFRKKCSSARDELQRLQTPISFIIQDMNSVGCSGKAVIDFQPAGDIDKPEPEKANLDDKQRHTLGAVTPRNLWSESHHLQKRVPNANISHWLFQLLKDIRRRLGNDKVTARQQKAAEVKQEAATKVTQTHADGQQKSEALA